MGLYSPEDSGALSVFALYPVEFLDIQLAAVTTDTLTTADLSDVPFSGHKR